MESAWLEFKLLTEYDYLLMKNWLIPSSAVAWGAKEVNSYQVLRLKHTQAYIDRMEREGPRSSLVSWAGISTVITLRNGSKTLDDRSLVALTVPRPRPALFIAEAGSAVPIQTLVNAPGRVEAKVALAKPATLVFSEVDYPGWTARVDGARIAHHLFADTFMAVPLAGGEHIVEWRYLPNSFLGGTAITLLAILLLMIS
jgi:hypothetical protein